MTSKNKIWRLIFSILLTVVGGVVGAYSVREFWGWVANDGTLHRTFAPESSGYLALYTSIFVIVGGIFGFAFGGALFRRIEILGEQVREMSVRDKLALIGGIIVAIILTAVMSLPIFQALGRSPLIAVTVTLLVGIFFTYISQVAASSIKEQSHIFLPTAPQEELPKERFKILDTNVIIDGRIADVARAGFLEGPIYVPGFVLDELQYIADSGEDLKRQRGRRGLDILKEMDRDLKLVVRTYDRLIPATGEVDGKLVQLTKALNGALVTNDWNLNRVADLQGVQVLNVNELANAVKSVVLPNEEMHVLLVKEGKEAEQAVGYLDDGTMIVVGGGKRHIGEDVNVLVSSVVQTAMGKMIFAHLREEGGSNGSNNGYANGNGERPPRRRR